MQIFPAKTLMGQLTTPTISRFLEICELFGPVVNEFLVDQCRYKSYYFMINLRSSHMGVYSILPENRYKKKKIF